MMPIYGVQPVLEALRAERRVVRILIARAKGAVTEKVREEAERLGVPVVEASKEEITKRVGHPGHQGVFAELGASESASADRSDRRGQKGGRSSNVREKPKEGPELDLTGIGDADLSAMTGAAAEKGEAPLILLLDHIQDPQNLGALIRSAHALGAHGVVIPRERAAPITPAVVRASAGAALHLPISTVPNLKRAIDELRELDVWSAAAVLDGETSWEARLDGGLALVIGSEGKGVAPSLAAYCDLRVTIPLPGGFDSLNASVAGGILLYEAQRQRRDRSRSS